MKKIEVVNDTKQAIVFHPACKEHGAQNAEGRVMPQESREVSFLSTDSAMIKLWNHGGNIHLLVSPDKERENNDVERMIQLFKDRREKLYMDRKHLMDQMGILSRGDQRALEDTNFAVVEISAMIKEVEWSIRVCESIKN